MHKKPCWYMIGNHIVCTPLLAMAIFHENQHLDRLQRLAEAHGGKLLSTIWTNNHAKYRFVLADGREFEMRASDILWRGWPKNQDAMTRTPSVRLAEVRATAEANNGRLISTEWLGQKAKLRFAFADGREFEMTPDSLKRWGWPKDPDGYLKNYADTRVRGAIHLESLREIAEANGGKLLSTEWMGIRIPHRFAFQDGREFEIAPADLKKGNWPKNADRYLKTSSQRLDELRAIAQAHDGRLLSTRWVGSRAKYRFAFADGREFEVRIDRLRIHGWPKQPDLYFARARNQQNAPERRVESSPAPATAAPVEPKRRPGRAERGLNALRAIAAAHSGSLLSTKWMGINIPHRFAFSDGREFEAKPAQLRAQGWPKDADRFFRKNKITRDEANLETLRSIAEANNGRLISTKWMGSQVKHRFAFADGREFEMRPGSMKFQGWPKDPDRYLRLAKCSPKEDVPAGGLAALLTLSTRHAPSTLNGIDLAERVKAFKEEKEGKRPRPLLW